MAGHADRTFAVARRIAALSLVALCGACGTVSDPAGFSIVAQDRYDFMDCRDIVPNRNALIAREKTLADLAAKAESSPGGVIVSYSAYRSELTQTRALLVAANRAAQKNNCDLTKK
ncbi:MAG: hypothetical protein JO000_12970 [Alphaproteobacteria bacterium]|nr:hypothetical protein [Alphaproteobacteria bacterium]